MIVPVLMAGGSGTRLWPLSRELYPKQFLRLAGEQTMLQQTVARAAALPSASAPIVVCGDAHRFIVAEQLKAVDGRQIILEPMGRNTAPAAAVAALQVAAAHGDDALVLLLPADHVIADQAAFAKAAQHAATLAQQGKLVTFGVVPTQPETGYGYIRTGEALGDAGHSVAAFVEKPDRETAEGYLADGGYLWNGGMFLFQAKAMLAELRMHAPAVLDACEAALNQGQRDLDFLRLDADAFAACPEDSIDYAVMEKTSNAAVVALDAGWNDLGAWTYLGEVSSSDAKGNVLSGDVLTADTTNTLVRAESRLVATVGLDNHVVVETADAVLVAPRNRVQDVKAIVGQLKAAGRSEAKHHPVVYRPWGSYETIALADRFQVKRIVVKPGAKLSLQMHHHRAEHWIVVKGTAIVTRGDDTLRLTEDQSTYIPLGTKHRLENPGVIDLELIEVQSGSYLGEDDIVRFQDDYNRA
ncbi:mannose-1-phosphate guanylyltransferase/mannose-6-phosphate isomerase [bacterium]|nr:mannose-1-phosphate guanylyltransferase/mannose-6-phosphate isomerase [bacterium]